MPQTGHTQMLRLSSQGLVGWQALGPRAFVTWAWRPQNEQRVGGGVFPLGWRGSVGPQGNCPHVRDCPQAPVSGWILEEGSSGPALLTGPHARTPAAQDPARAGGSQVWRSWQSSAPCPLLVVSTLYNKWEGPAGSTSSMS